MMLSLLQIRQAAITAAIVSLGLPSLLAQLTVDVEMPIEQMVQNLVGEGVQISNISVNAADSAYAYYYSAGTELGTNQGLLLSTGLATRAVGPNNSSGLPQLGSGGVCLNCNLFDNNFPGSPLLNLFAGYNTFDACLVEFDIVPQGDSLRFSYTFASEEYQEWVGSPFNDVFGFFITGPNVGTDVNLALVPGSSQAVAVNTVNHLINTAYYDNNITPPGVFIQYDGLTVNLVAEVGNLIPCETYHLKLAIADGSDRIYDSAVFIRSIESNPVVVASATAGGLPYMIEGCNDGTITFTREEVSPDPQTVTYFVGGTATNGVDYLPQLGGGDLGDPVTITIPGGQSSASIDIQPLADGVTEGDEYMIIYLANPLCNNTEILDSLIFFIQDSLVVSVTPQTAELCSGACVQLTGQAESGGLAGFSWSPTAGLSDPSLLNPLACPATTTTYVLTGTAADCISTDEVTITVSNLTLTADAANVQCFAQNTGTVDLSVSNGVVPYIIVWTGPGGFTAATEDLSGLAPGVYCVEVTDANGCQESLCVTLVQVNELAITNASFSEFGCSPISCFGFCDGAINIGLTGGVLPYTFSWSGPDGFASANEDISALCAGTYCVTVTDAAGCSVSACYTLNQPAQLTLSSSSQNNIDCNGNTSGSACVTAAGGCAPYLYLWDHDGTLSAPCAENLEAGTYTVEVTDINNCPVQANLQIVLSEPSAPLSIDNSIIQTYPGGSNVSCFNAADGSVNVTVSGGTPGYTYVWTNAFGVVVGAGEDLINAPCGSYQLLVTDANGCTAQSAYTLSCVDPIAITFGVTPNPCGAGDAGLGAIVVTSVTGGNGGSYTFSYSGPSCNTCNTQNVSGIDSGQYTLTVSDNQGCSQTFDIFVGTDDAFTVTPTLTPVSCFGQCTGAIDLDIFPAGLYNTSWFNGEGQLISTSEDVANLCAGNYLVIVGSGACVGTFSYTISQPAPVVVSVSNTTPPVCFGQNNGCIDISVSGAVGTPDYNWLPNPECFFAGSTNEDLCGLFACTYSVIVTDDNGCSGTLDVQLTAPLVMNIFVETSIYNGGYNISCNGANDGAISVSVSGGTPDCSAFAPYCYNYDWHCDDPVCSVPTNCSGPVQTGLSPGIYCVDVFDVNGCLATTTITIEEPDPIVSVSLVNDVTCNGLCDGQVFAGLSGGSGTYLTINWTGDIGSNPPTALNLTNLCAGSYTLQVFDSNDCSETFTYTVGEPELLVIELDGSEDIACAGLNTGGIAFHAEGGSAPYTYWIENENGVITPGNIFTSLSAGTYTLYAEDEQGCQATLTVTIDEPQVLQLQISPVIQIPEQVFVLQCNGDCDAILQASVSGGTSPYNYVWTDDDGAVIGTGASLSNLCAGIYCMTVTDANGCVVSACFDVTEPDAPLTITSVVSDFGSGNEISCGGSCDGTIDLTVTGGVPAYNYQWNCSNCGGLNDVEDQSSLCAGFYEVLVTDANFCDQLLQFTLDEPEPVIVTPDILVYGCGFNVSCADACDGGVNLEVSGGVPGYTVDWDNDLLPDDFSLSGLCPGTYTACVIDNIGCEVCIPVTLVAPQAVSVAINRDVDCNTGLVVLCAEVTGGCGPYTYAWPNGDTDDCLDINADGDYCIDVLDANGCAGTACALDVVDPDPFTGQLETTPTTCGACNGSLNLVLQGGVGPFDIDWTGAGTVDGALQQNDLCPGDYSVVVTDALGCVVTASATIPGDDVIEVNETVSGVSCFGGANGVISVSIENATEPVSLTWLDSDGNAIGNGNTLSGLSAGEYTLNWSDAAGCTGSEVFTVAQPLAPLGLEATLSLYENGFNISTFGGNDGFIVVTATGGTAPYDYTWNPTTGNDTTSVNLNLEAGIYSLTLTDAQGCAIDTSFVLAAPLDLGFPTGFSPNGDGSNQFYVIQGVESFPDNEFKVFNRWGNLVYEKSGYNNEWEGQNMNGEPLADGTYYVVFRAGSTEFNSYVDLRR
jgi:gliding motility-associated-like protein